MRIQTIADSIARWSLIAFALLTPFFVLTTSWATPFQAKMLLATVFVIVAFLSWLTARLVEGSMSIPRNLILFVAPILPLVYFISALISKASVSSYVSGSGAEDTVSALVLLCSVLLLGALIARGETFMRTHLRFPIVAFFALTLGASVVVLFQILRLFIPGYLTLGGAITGSSLSLVGSAHDLAILCALVVFVTTVMWNAPFFTRGYRQYGVIALGVLSFALLTVIGMIDAWYVLFGMLILFAVYRWGSARFHEGKSNADAFWRGAISLIVGILALISAFAAPLIHNQLPASFQFPQAEVRPSWKGTFLIGQKVFKGPALVFGLGPNTFSHAWAQYKPAGVNQTEFWNTDFDSGVGAVPTSFVTVGILGGLAWIVFLGALLFGTWRFVRRERLSATRLEPAAILGSILFLAAFHVLSSPGTAISIILFLLVGLFIATETEETDQRFQVNLGFRSPRLAIVLGAVMAIVLVCLSVSVYTIRATIADLLVVKSATYFNRTGDVKGALALVHRALFVFPENSLAHRAGVELGLLQMQTMISNSKTDNTEVLQATLSNTIQEALKVVSINSGDYQNWLTLAQLYQNLGGVGVDGAYENAISAYQKAIAKSPTNPLPLLGAAQVAIAQGDATSSFEYLNSAIALKPDVAAAYYLRSKIAASRGDFSAAIEDGKRTVSIAREDPLAWYNLGAILYASNDYEGAVQALQQAVALNNDYANALFVLSLSFDKLKNRADAIRAMEMVLKLNPNDPRATSALAMLKAGKPIIPASSQTQKAR